MANPPKPWKVDYAKSAKSKCQRCKNKIDKQKLRLGIVLQSTKHDGFVPLWYHVDCLFKKANRIKCLDDIEGLELLRWEDQKKIGRYVDGGGHGLQNNTAPAVIAYGIEVSQSSRATCKHCNQKITKSSVRISIKSEGGDTKGLAWHHASCFMELSPTTQVEELSGWDCLSASDQAVVSALTKKPHSTTKVADQPYAGSKRKRAENADQKKFAGSELGESQREAQTNELWALKDDLEKYVTKKLDLKEMLKANSQCSKGSPLDLLDRCVDGMLFGALARCPHCHKSTLYFAGDTYRCFGEEEWGKCSYSTKNAERVKGKWKIPEETTNQYLCKWFKSQKANKPVRILRQPANDHERRSKDEYLGDLKVAIAGGVPKEFIEEWKREIENAGGQVHPKIKKGVTNCFVVGDDVPDDDKDAEMRKAREMKLPIVNKHYLYECITRRKKLPFDQYKIEYTSNMTTKIMQGRGVVHESSGLQDWGHILKDGNNIYSINLNKCDLSDDKKSYYILQIIQDDEGSDCYVFRNWGRHGNKKVNKMKLDGKMTQSDAIKNFKDLFLKQTGNPWEAWEEQKFQKRPGKFLPVDNDDGVNNDVNEVDDVNSLLAPSLVELMKMLFNVETYRDTMRKFKIDVSQMPLGKLSKHRIKEGFEALTRIENILNSNVIKDEEFKKRQIRMASNEFFSKIPSIDTNVIEDEDDLKSKINVLEGLWDIEIASSLVGFENQDSLDEKYKKLRCEVAPLPHESEDYQLIKKYLETTKDPTDRLELEEVFSLEREGESHLSDKLKNKMLLWHGSRLTNFVGILNQGLRIAPPEAPPSGYDYGKGIYFADQVSNSAIYCHPDGENSLRLILLCEVALGEVNELKAKEDMTKLPQGKNSTKGLGRKKPQESGYFKWRDEIVVPCGKPVPSNVVGSDRTYNEYIVYDTAQTRRARTKESLDPELKGDRD
ncbi:hypothetical protein F0562_022491 [Nyssa sinensis]|uniref:Poly [ADP-ribose] polymerase n=1 Tax=Nyssa sinensis TaxID=561372 RepID=A0A5J5BNR6_9ASTE|nr:hypothetical protein F0562_022491 [Nyssa sinensis]